MRHPTHLTHNRMRPPHVHGEPKGGGEVPEMLLFFLAEVVLVGPTSPAPLTADDGGGGAQLDEGGCNLEQDETPVRVRRVMWA